MTTVKKCGQCGAEWQDSQTCTDNFHLLCGWELDHGLLALHHLMVLCFHLQHPNLYSPEALNYAKHMLVDFLEHDLSPDEARNRITQNIGKHSKITGTDSSYGTYDFPVHWSIVVQDVVNAGINEYYSSIRRWSASILESLRESGNLDYS